MNSQHLRHYIVRPTLEAMSMWSPAAENLVLGTAAQESRCGYYLKQLNGPACGVYQMEPATAIDLVKRYLKRRSDIDEQLQSAMQLFGDYEIDWDTVPESLIAEKLISDLRFATAMCRLRYYVVPERLPDQHDVFGLADYWKRYYNTEKGAGTRSEFNLNYVKFVKGTA